MNPRPLGYEPNELPDCSTPRHVVRTAIQQRAPKDSRDAQGRCQPGENRLARGGDRDPPRVVQGRDLHWHRAGRTHALAKIRPARESVAMQRVASCSCGGLRITCEGEPVRISICHCPACQRRTGSVFAVQARYPDSATRIEGNVSQWVRRADDGDAAHFRFCPVCSSTVFWTLESLPGFTTVAVGAFADPKFPSPTVSVWEEARHGWVLLPADMEHID